MAKQELTPERLREQVHYDPETGLFTRKVANSPNADMNPTAGYKSTNSRACTNHFSLSIDGRLYLSHRLAWLFMTGEWPEGEIDHIDGNGQNNRWVNLRGATRSENSRNLSKPKNNASGVVGVNWRESKKRWRAFIQVNRKAIHLGYFMSMDEAIEARRSAEAFFGFHPNHGRPSPWPSF